MSKFKEELVIENLVNWKDAKSKVMKSRSNCSNPRKSVTSVIFSSRKSSGSIRGRPKGLETYLRPDRRPKIGQWGQPLQDREPMPGAEDVESRQWLAGNLRHCLGSKMWIKTQVGGESMPAKV